MKIIFISLNKTNLFFIFLFLIQVFFFYQLTPIDFECDAGALYATGKFLYDVITLNNFNLTVGYRPPGFNLYTIFTGLYLFDSFYPWIFVNIFFSLISFIIFNLFINNFNKFTQIFGNIILLSSNILLIHSKLFLEMHLLTNLLLLNIFFCYKFYSSNKLIFFYTTILIAVFMFYTRFDMIFVLFFDFIFCNFILLKKNSLKKFIKNFLIISSICFLSLFTWLSAKHLFLIHTNENKNFESQSQFILGSYTSLNHQTGAQLLWRINNDLRNTIKLNDPENYIFNFLNRDNGPYARELYTILNEAVLNPQVIKKIESFKNKMHPLSKESRHLSKLQNYNKHYGLYLYDDPKIIVDQIFSSKFESFYYPLQIQILLIEHIGRIKADKLLKNVSIEIINKNKNIRQEITLQFFESIGLGLKNEKSLFFNAANEIVWLNISPINIGDCSKSVMSDNLYKQYEKEYNNKSKTINSKSETFYKVIAYSKNFIFELTSFIIIVFSPFALILYKRNIFMLLTLTKYLSSVFIISIFSSIVGHKYDNYLSVFMIFISIFIFNELVNQIKKIKKN